MLAEKAVCETAPEEQLFSSEALKEA